MQAIILAAGMGSRLGALSEGRPKSLLDVGGKSIIARQVESLRALHVEEIVVVTGHESDRVQGGLRGIPNVRFVFNPQFQETNVLASWLLGSEYLKEDH